MRLVISTATAACSVALVDDGRVLAEAHEVVGRGHAERLIPMIAELPEQGRADEIIVDCGPGSFTGVRVGLAAARGLAIAWGVPLHGISTLALIATSATQDCAIATQGGHGELFVQRFHVAPLRAADALQSLTPEAAAAAIDDVLVLGSGADALVTARGSGSAVDALPRAADARLLPLELRTLAPIPIYGRAPDAKAK